MSATTPAGTPAGPGSEATAGRSYCTRCGARLDADQEWCLECGLARTIIRSAPDWRVPLLVIGAVILAALVAFAIAIINLGGSGSTSTVTVRATAAPAAGSSAHAATLQSWPPGLSGYTVVLDRDPSQSVADGVAQKLAARGILGIGVLDSSDHPHMRPGSYVVFAKRYPTLALAQAAADQLVRSGQPQAAAREVAPPGGI
jgi:hypothetical protein